MRIRPWLAVLLLAGGCGKKPPAAARRFDPAPAFWIWHRSSPLATGETRLLARAGTERLYRQVGEFGWRDGGWSARPACGSAVIESPGTIPVIRLDPGPGVLERPDAAASLAKWLRHHFKQAVPTSLQVDHDCPARLLGRYAGFLGELRAELALEEISVTALASWIESPAFPRLAEAADEIVPMFYDLTADPPEDIVAGAALPMAGGDALRWIARWRSCPVPWRAGLPNFERLSLFKADGALIGHLRQWSPETLLGSPLVEAHPDFTGGAGYRVSEATVYHGTRLDVGQLLVWRGPGDDDLRSLIRRSADAGAIGVVWFALPGPGLRTTHSPPHLAALARDESPAPRLAATLRDDGSVVLRNEGPGDLSIHPGGTLHRLVLVSGQAGTFSAAGPGGFFETRSAIPPNFSRKLVLTFARLDVDDEIASAAGLISSRDDRDLRWSVDDSAPSPFP